VLELSDRVAVIHRGRIVGTFAADEAEREQIGLLMARGEAAAREEAAGVATTPGAGDDTGATR
jgi:ABC-type sugar transport system ATPase subunit